MEEFEIKIRIKMVRRTEAKRRNEAERKKEVERRRRRRGSFVRRPRVLLPIELKRREIKKKRERKRKQGHVHVHRRKRVGLVIILHLLYCKDLHPILLKGVKKISRKTPEKVGGMTRERRKRKRRKRRRRRRRRRKNEVLLLVPTGRSCSRLYGKILVRKRR
jgi:hypothetical protein